MPQITYEFKAEGHADVLKAIRSVGRAAKRLRRPYPPVQTPALTKAMGRRRPGVRMGLARLPVAR